MSINYIGADVDCMMTEIAIEKNGKITARDRVPTSIRSLRKCLDSISGKKEMVIEEGPMAGWLYRNLKSDAERLSVDPAMRHVVGERAKDKTAASVSQMGRFETEILTQPRNLKALINQTGKWVDEVHQRKSIKEIILDMDSSDSPTFGKQEGSAYNGHFGYTCYHPLFVFNQFGDMERALLRNGNVYSSDEIRQRNDGPLLHSCFCHYCG